MRRKSGIKIPAVIIISIGFLTLIPLACTSGQDINSPPLLDSPGKGNPKLDSQLNQLIRAEMQGEALSFAEQHGIELVGGNVRVIVECIAAQLDGATGAVLDAGAKLEASHDNLLQVVVPISSLETLAGTACIRFIRLPQQPLPGIPNEEVTTD